MRITITDSRVRWDRIIIHHSATKDGETVDWQAIRRYHVQEKKWDDIGYHFGLEYINGYYELLIGRPLIQTGAHTIGQNHCGIGICVVGNYDLIEPCTMQYELLATLCKDLCWRFTISPANIYAHNQFANKTCPGNMFDMEKLKTITAKGMTIEL
jgi:N-acetylmuramoyl-L-alanine amidase